MVSKLMHWIINSPELNHVESFLPGLGGLLFESIKNGDLKGLEDIAQTPEWEIILQHRFSFVKSSLSTVAINSNMVFEYNLKRKLHFCFHMRVQKYFLFHLRRISRPMERHFTLQSLPDDLILSTSYLRRQKALICWKKCNVSKEQNLTSIKI